MIAFPLYKPSTPKVYKEDAKSGTWRPPPNTNGTPNESVNDVFVRVRQVFAAAASDAAAAACAELRLGLRLLPTALLASHPVVFCSVCCCRFYLRLSCRRCATNLNVDLIFCGTNSPTLGRAADEQARDTVPGRGRDHRRRRLRLPVRTAMFRVGRRHEQAQQVRYHGFARPLFWRSSRIAAFSHVQSAFFQCLRNTKVFGFWWVLASFYAISPAVVGKVVYGEASVLPILRKPSQIATIHTRAMLERDNK